MVLPIAALYAATMRLAPLIPRPQPSAPPKRKASRKPFPVDGGSSAWGGSAVSSQIMPKLEVGDVNDPLEREAEAIADYVMRMPAWNRDVIGDDGSTRETSESETDEQNEEELTEGHNDAAFAGAASLPNGPGFVARRKCASCESEDDEDLRRSPADDLVLRACATCEDEDEIRRACASCEAEDEDIMREPCAGQRGGPVGSKFRQRVHTSVHNGGEPLSVLARSFLEPRLGLDLSRVRVHADAAAGSLAEQINARAFTLGQHIFFAPGQLRPHTHAGMHLLAHEVAHTLQMAGRRNAPLRRYEGPIEDLTAADLGADLGPDITEQDQKLQDKVDSVRHWLSIFIFDLVMPDKRYGNPSQLQENRVPSELRKQTERSAATFLGMTEQLEKSNSAPAAMLSRWLETAITTLELIKKCLRQMIRNARADFDGQVEADLVAAFEGFQPKVNSVLGRAKGLREHEFFRRGAELDAQIQEAWLEVRSAATEIYVEQQLEQAYKEMREYWQWQSKDEILAEKNRLSIKLIVGGQGPQSKLIEVQLQALQSLLDEVDGYHGPSQSEETETIVSHASKGNLAKAGLKVAELILRNELGATAAAMSAFSRISSDIGDDTVRNLAAATLQSLGPSAKAALDELATYDRGRTLLAWLEAGTDLEFAIICVRGTFDSTRVTLASLDPADARRAVQTTVDVLHGCDLLAGYARDERGKALLVEMTIRLWETGYNRKMERTGRLLASAITPVRGHTGPATRLPADDKVNLVAKPIKDNTQIQINLQGGQYSTLVDELGFDKQTAMDLYLPSKGVKVPIDSVVVFETGDADEAWLAPAIRLLEVNAKSTRSAATALGQEISRRAEVTAEVLGQGVDMVAKAFEKAEQALATVVTKANGWIEENLPPNLQLGAKAVVWVVDKVGTAYLSRAALAAGFTVGVVKGAADTVIGTIDIAGKAIEGLGGISKGIQDGTLVQRVDVTVRETTRQVGFVIEVAPELIDECVGALVKEFAEGSIIKKSFMAGRAAGRITFEVGMAAMGGAALKGKKLDDLMDLGKGAQRAGDLADEVGNARKLEMPEASESSKHGDVNIDPDRPARGRADGELEEGVRVSGNTESDMLTARALENELEFMRRHPELMKGAPPNRRFEIGEHTWVESPDGRWCRHSEGSLCLPDEDALALAYDLARWADDGGHHYPDSAAVVRPDFSDAQTKKLVDKHGIDAVRWATQHLPIEQADGLLSQLSPKALEAIMDVPSPVAARVIYMLGAREVNAALSLGSAGPLRGSHLYSLLSELHPRTVQEYLEWAGNVPGRLSRVARTGAWVNPANAAIPAGGAVGKRTVILDNNARIAIDELLRGKKIGALDPNYQEAIKGLRKHLGLPQYTDPGVGAPDMVHIVGPDADIRVTTGVAAETLFGETKSGLPSAALTHTQRVAADRAHPDYPRVIKELSGVTDGQAVGGKGGIMDRSIIADALLAQAQPGVTPTLITTDANVLKRLAARFARAPHPFVPNPTDPLMTQLRSAYPNGWFEIDVLGHKLRVVFDG